jgi:galactonate dehydratase
MMEEPCADTVDRRELLAAAGMMAAGAVMLSGPGPLQAAIEDRFSTIKISRLKATAVGPKAFVRIDTNHQITGWGEITGLEPKVASALVESLFELLDGENPTRIEHLWQKLYRAHRDMRGGPFMVHTLSAIDMALWDIAGKLHGVPVYQLLGGPCRQRIRMYNTPKAHKTGTGGPHPWSGGYKDLEGLVQSVAHSRKMVGPDGAVMFDAHCAVPPPLLIQFAAAIHPYDVLWIEEPVVPGNIEVFKKLKQAIRIPIATGERDRTIWEVMPYLQHQCIDILQSDVGHCGGITQLRKIATLAETFYVPMAPHNTCSELGLTASLHVSASIPLFLIQEGYVPQKGYSDHGIMPQGLANKSWEIDKEGYASLPQGPGLGVEMSEAMMSKIAADPKHKFKWPHPTYPQDESVRDY